MNENNLIKRFNNIVFEPDIPALYGQGLTDYEIICRIAKTVNECVDTINSFNDLAKQLEGALADLDTYVKNEIIAIIQEMYEDGTLSQALAEALNTYFNEATAPKTTLIDMRRLCRVHRAVNTYNSATVNEELYSFGQGGCYYTKNGKDYFICCFVVGNNGTYKYNDNADVRIYGRYGDNWRFENHKVLSINHANSIAYDEVNDVFYVASSLNYAGGTTALATDIVYKLDYNLNIISSTNFTNFASPFGITKVALVACYKGDLYIGLDGSRVYIHKVTDFANGESELLYNIPFESSITGLGGAGMAITDNFIFVGVTQPNGIVRVNRITNTIDWFYNIGNFANGHMFPVGEIEWVSATDTHIYVGSSINANSIVNYSNFMQVFAYNYVNNNEMPTNLYPPQGAQYRNVVVGDITSDVSVDPDYKEISNPNGLSASSPFPTISEALLFANAQNQYSSLIFTLKTRNLLEAVVISTNKNIELSGATYHSNHSGDDDILTKYIHLGALIIVGAPSVSLNEVQIENRLYTDGGLSSVYTDYQIVVRDCNFNMTGGRIYIYNRPQNYTLYANRIFGNTSGTIYLNSSEWTAINNDNVNLINSSINFHGKFTSTNSNVLCSQTKQELLPT